jgi:hypothetical protein
MGVRYWLPVLEEPSGFHPLVVLSGHHLTLTVFLFVTGG